MDYDLKSLKNIVDNININFDIDIDAVKSSRIFNTINQCINNTDIISVNKTYSTLLHKIHTTKEYPLMFIIIRKLKELNLLDKLIPYSIDMNDFWLFISWYREHHHVIDTQKLKSLMIDSGDDILLNCYQVIFSHKDRSPIHSILYDNPFVSIDIQHHYESEDIIYEKYEGDGLTVNLYKLASDKTSYINRIVTTVSLMRCFAKKYDGYLGDLCLNIFLGNQTKKLTINHDGNIPLCADNTNSGSCVPGEYINIWRKEEMLKVLIHELVHFHKFDFHYTDNNYSYLEKKINNRIKIIGVDRCNESYTESLAVLIYLCILCKMLSIDFHVLLNIELNFLLYQVCKIIKYFGGESIRDMFRITLKQNTSIRSYFIIKYMMLCNLDTFVKFIDDTGNVKNNIDKYGDFIGDIIESNRYIHNTSRVFKDIIDLDRPDFVNRTMRMSIFELFI
jgi:hypothetical protein